MVKKEISIFSREVEVPKFVENDRENLVRWGKDNLIPQWLNYLYYTCAVHQGIINGKVMFTIGGGLKGNKELVDFFDPILKYLDTDLEISNSFYVKGIYNPDGSDKFKDIKYIPYEWVRVTKDGKYVVCEDWSNPTAKKVEYVSINDRTDEMVVIIPFKEAGKQFKIDPTKRELSMNYYPVVPYSGAVKSIMTDIEYTNYEFSEVVNSFSGGTILSLNNGASPLEGDRNEIKDYIIDNATGSDNAGGVVILFNNGKETEPTVLHLNGNQLHERYLALGEAVQKKILIGHSVISGELFGFTQDGNFNQSNLEVAYHFMKANYFKVRQNQLLSVIDAVAQVNGITEGVEFIEYQLPKAEVTQPTAYKIEKFSADDEDKVLAEFSKFGRDNKDLDIIFSGDFDIEKFRQEFIDLTKVQGQVLDLISKGNLFDGIYKALEINPSDLAKHYDHLYNEGLINEGGEITTKGKLEVAKRDISRVTVEYSYDVKDGYGDKVIPGTRNFCRKLIELNKVYTMDEINTISATLGMDVWRYRGGWYHNPNTNRNEPACRHIWKQNIIFR